MNKILSEIAKLKTPLDIIKFTTERIVYLEERTPIREISLIRKDSQLYNGYINMNSEIYANRILLPPFYIDDINLYINLLKFIHETFNLRTIDNYDFKSFITIIQMYIEKTFMAQNLSKTDREIIYNNNYSHVSIKNFYQNGSAKCIERTAAVQNILSFLGIETYIFFNELSTSDNKEITETHAINIVKYNGKLWAYDSKNMMHCEKNGKIINLPGIVELKEKDIHKVKSFTMEPENLAKIYNAEPHKLKRKKFYRIEE